MLQALLSLGHTQFEWAKWFPGDKEHFERIQVGIVSESAKRFDTVITNLITQSNSTMLFTAYAYPYAVRQHIFYREKWWEITNVGERSLDVNPQAMALVKPSVHTQYILEIIEVSI